jgi:hypothetical protein
LELRRVLRALLSTKEADAVWMIDALGIAPAEAGLVGATSREEAAAKASRLAYLGRRKLRQIGVPTLAHLVGIARVVRPTASPSIEAEQAATR